MITLAEYHQRRKTLMKSLGANAIAIVPAALHHKRTHSSDYPYRQDSNFYYLSGFSEPNAVLVFVASSQEVILFNQEQDPKKMQWEGPVLGQTDACKVLGVDASYSIEKMHEHLPKLIESKTLYSTQDDLPGIDSDKPIESLLPLLAQQRLIKSPAEIELMRKAAQISAAGHRRGMRETKHCEYEYQLAAEYEYAFKREGGNDLAYSSIVGGGANACVLHYHANHDKLLSGDLVLVDAATEYQNYSSDITRTYPVSGKFSSLQKDIYNVVLKAQENAIKQVKPGATWDVIQEQVVDTMVQGLLDINVLTGKKDEIIQKQSYRDFYMHSIGHWLGLDVHDVGAYKIDDKPRPFEPGMVLTIEPGVYLSDKKIGIRIEDDIVVTETGCDVLSKDVAKTVNDIENAM